MKSLLLLGAAPLLFALLGCTEAPLAPLSPADVQAITAIIERDTRMSIKSIRPEPGGVAVAFLASDNLGRQEIKLIRQNGQWRMLERTLFF